MKNYTPTKTENAYIIGRPTGHLFDFIYTVENKTEKPLTLNFCDDGIEPIHLPPLEWVGLEFDDAGIAATYSIENGEYFIIEE